MALADTAKLVVNLSLGGNFQSGIAKATRDLHKFDSAVSNSASRSYKAGQQIGNGLKNIGKIGLVAATGIAAVAAASLHAAGDFEAQLNTINTIARTTGTSVSGNLGKIGDSIRKVARETGTSLDDLTQGYYDLLSAGIKTADAQNVLVQANTLAIGGLSTTAEAIDLLTTAINTYGGDASQAAVDTDVFAKAIERGKVTAAELSSSFATVGPLAAAYGVSIQEIGAAYARLTAAGVPAAEAATQMRSAIQALAKPDKGLKALEAQTKKNYLTIAGKQGLVVALQMMRQDAAKAGIPLSALTARIEAMQFLLQTTGPNFAAYQADLAAMGKAAGTAAGQMAERQQGLNFQLAVLKANAKDAGISIGSALLPKITPLVKKLNELVSGEQGQKAIKDFGDALSGLFTDENIKTGVDAIGQAFQIAKDAAPAIAGAAKITGAALKVAVDAFNALPPEIKSIAIAGLAINKLTGGLVTNLIGGLGGALAKSLINTPLVNVNGGVVNVNGGIGGGLPGALPGAAGAAGGLGLGTVILGAGAAAALGGAVGAAVATGVTSVIAPSDLAQAQQGNSLGNRDPRRFDKYGNVIANSTTELVALARNADQRDAANSAAIVGAIKAQTAENNLVAAAKRDAETSAAIAPAIAKAVADKLATVATGIQTAANQRDAETSSSINEIVKQQATASDIETLRSTTYTGLTGSIAATQTADTNISSAATSAGNTAAEAARNAGSTVAGAINAKDLSINQAIDIKVNVSAAGVSKSVVVQNRYGPGNGSAGGGRDGEGGGGPGQ